MNALQMVLGIIDRPAVAQAHVAERPRIWWVAALIVVLSLVVLTAATAEQSITLANERSQEAIERSIQAQQLTEEQAQVARQRASSMATMTLPRYWLVTVVLGTLFAAIGWVARSAVVHFVSMAVGGVGGWSAAFAITVWAQIPLAVRSILQAVYSLVSGRLIEHQGLSFLVAQSDWMANSRSIPYTVLSQLDPFVLWYWIVFAAGIAAATKVKKGTAAVLAVIIWAIFLGLGLIPVLINRAINP